MRFVSNRFSKDAKGLALATTERVNLFYFIFLGFVCCYVFVFFFLISPSGETPGEIRDFHAVSRGFYLISFQWAG